MDLGGAGSDPMRKAVFILAALFAVLLVPGRAYSGEPVRVMVMDDLERLTIHFPASYDVWDETGGAVSRDGSGASSIVLGRDSRLDGGIRVKAEGSVVNINEFALTGNIDITKNDKGLYRVVNELDMEGYTRAVVGVEMDPRWPVEALKAQAVAARTYALYRKSKPGCEGYDLCATTNSQMFTGDGRFKEGPAQAVAATKGLVLAVDGHLAETLYHGSCGGRTEDASEVWDRPSSYLKSVPCACTPGGPYDEWTRKFTKAEVETALVSGGLNAKGIMSIRVAGRSPSGRIRTLKVEADGGSFELKGAEFRRLMGYTKVPSTYFIVNRYEGGFIITGSGSGHGVGMCQWGAKAMAEDGKKYYEILAHYYPGRTLESMDNIKDGGR